MHTNLAQIKLKNTRLVTYSAYYTVIPEYDSVLWKLALAMASTSFGFDRALAYALSCVKQEGVSLKDQQVEAVKLLSEGKDILMWFPTGYGKSICYQLQPFLFDVRLGRTNAPLLTEVSFLLFLPLCLIVHEYYFPCHLSVFSLNFTIVLRHVLLLNLRLQLTRPYTINTRPYFLPTIILVKNRPGNEATA